MKHLIFFLSMILIVSCSSNLDGPVDISTVVQISIKDANGVDLLDPNSPNALNQDEFKITYDVNGEKIKYFDGNLDSPKDFRVTQYENEYRFAALFQYMYKNKDIKYPTIYIQWSENDTDTLKCEIERKGASKSFKNVWFNGELVVWKPNESCCFFEIIK